MSLTSLIDVIFLLLLFFMLTSTFSKFTELNLPLGGQATSRTTDDRTIFFLRVSEDLLSLNGRTLSFAEVSELVDFIPTETRSQLIVSMTDTVSSQTLVDILALLRDSEELDIAILGN